MHEMRYLGLRTNYHEFICDECGRHVLFHSNPTNAYEGQMSFVILNVGDFYASHFGAVGKWVVDNVEVRLEDEIELSDVWREGLEDVL